MVHGEEFGKFLKFTIINGDTEVTVSDLGATVLSVKYRGHETVLGYGSPEEYLSNTSYIGAVVGRYANRIANSEFTIGNTVFMLPPNEGRNHLHGGPDSFDRRVWDVDEIMSDSVRFSIFSEDGDNGYPGNLKFTVTYKVSESGFKIIFSGNCDEDTVFAPTTHMYFDPDGNGDILKTHLIINSREYIETDSELLPVSVNKTSGTRFDFSGEREIGEDYDHYFFTGPEFACKVRGKNIGMTMKTDFPGVQFYTGSGLQPPHHKNSGFAIEPAYPPDSPNRSEFISPILKKGDVFSKYVQYEFEEI